MTSTSLPFEDYVTDWQPEELEAVLINETPIDFACYHGTPIWDYFFDGHIAFEKGLPLRDKHPNRVILYGPVNPLATQEAVEDMERMVADHDIRGIPLTRRSSTAAARSSTASTTRSSASR